jgi:ABC-type sulfate transport system permease component
VQKLQDLDLHVAGAFSSTLLGISFALLLVAVY